MRTGCASVVDPLKVRALSLARVFAGYEWDSECSVRLHFASENEIVGTFVCTRARGVCVEFDKMRKSRAGGHMCTMQRCSWTFLYDIQIEKQGYAMM